MTETGVNAEVSPRADTALHGNPVRSRARGLWLWLTVATLLLLLLAPVSLWWARDALLDSDYLKDPLLDQLEFALGRRPQLDGTVRVALLRPRTENSGAPGSDKTQILITIGAGQIPSLAGFSPEPLLAWEALRLVIGLEDLRNHIFDAHPWRLRELSLRGVTLHAERDASGNGNWQGLLGDEPTPTTADIQLESLQLQSGRFRYRRTGNQADTPYPGDDPSERDDLFVAIEELRVDRLRVSPDGSWHIESLQADSADAGQLRLGKLVISTTDDAADSDRLDHPRLSLNTEWSLRNLPLRMLPLPAWLAESTAPLRLASASGHGQLRQVSRVEGWQLEQARLRLDTLHWDDSRLVGEVHWDSAGLNVQLQLDQLRLDPYLIASRRPDSRAVPDTRAVPDSRAAPDRPPTEAASLLTALPLERWVNRPLRGRIQIGELSLAQDRAREVVLELTP